MICETCRPLLSEHTDGRLSATQRRQMETHLAGCAECAALVADFRSLGGLLRGLPAAHTSPQFEARLAERLSHTKSPQAYWLGRWSALLRPAPSVWRPALAFGAAAAAFAGILSFQHPNTVMQPQTPTGETALVTQCVQQHRIYVGAQPLSDPAAQNLASRMDETMPGLPAPSLGEDDF